MARADRRIRPRRAIALGRHLRGDAATLAALLQMRWLPLGYALAAERLPPRPSARECLTVQAVAKQLAAIDAEVLQLADALGLTPWLDEAVATMSYGTRQKLGCCSRCSAERRWSCST